MKIKRLLTALLSFVLALSSTVSVFAASGPNKYLGYIEIYDAAYTTDILLYDNYYGAATGTIKGATYNESTNTLTLNNFKEPTLCITTNTMGDDFKINLTGENHIQYLGVWGDGHGGSCEFTGSGKLYVNENKLARTAIYMSPEGTNSVMKASGSTEIYAYAPSGGNSLYVDATENKNCIIGNISSTPKAENVSFSKTIPVITGSGSSKTYNIYTKQGDSDKFAVEIRSFASNYTIYKIVENPDGDNPLLIFYKSGQGDFVDGTDGFIKTDETVYATVPDYSTGAPLWKDGAGNRYIFDWTYDSESGSSYYKKCSVKEYVKVKVENGEIQWYIATPTDDETRYANDRTAPASAGYVNDVETLEGVYNLYVSASSFTLTGGKHTHSYKNVVTKATLTKNGKIVPTCSCGATKSETTIAYPKTIKLSATSYVYDGKAKKPTVTVKDSAGKTIASSNYTVTYPSGRKNVGKYSVKITFKGNYTGTKTLDFMVVPKATTLSSVTAASKGFTAKWKKQATQTTGYEIQLATDSKFTKNKKSVVVTKNTTTSKKITKLSSKKKYYVRIRTYKTVSGKKYYSAWSKAKTVTTKK